MTTIICVIHINPGSDIGKTRGHFGSQLARKAESNLRLVKDKNEVVTAYTESSRHAFISEKDGPRYEWEPLVGMHVSLKETAREAKTNAVSAATKLRYQTLAAKVFAIAVVYKEAIKHIMKVEEVKERQA